ncbi:MAG TPA: queuosine precursor transporter [Pirellulaceae bacterium]|nr:queuosine precursor transporter [Pirellulaceae bacterium]HMO93785.1 queuosine precursor transporter [Pirellulaceae bacterium]HMP70621.1 queuosine precursor transporter [Pirellulaceae bacterium]
MTDKASQTLHPIEASELHARRERVFLVLAGIFLGTLAMLNILGISRFIVLFSISPDESGSYQFSWGQWGEISFALAVGVLPYPITFLCTDLISEFYGRRRANWVVTVGLFINLWVVFILWVGGLMPSVPPLDPTTGLPATDDPAYAFYTIRKLAFGAVTASMIAYMAAQFCDVYLYHFWRRITRGRHLWLRNNGSTIVSQLVDTTAVILITHFYAAALPAPPEGRSLATHLLLFIVTGYAFKFVVALLDTIPLYILVHIFRKYLKVA